MNTGCLFAVQLPVLVSDLDLECKMWIKLRLAPMCPYIGSLSLAFVGAPIIKVQLLPYNRVRIMRIPILQVRPGPSCELCPSWLPSIKPLLLPYSVQCMG